MAARMAARAAAVLLLAAGAAAQACEDPQWIKVAQLNPHAGDECPGEMLLVEAKHHTTGNDHPTLGSGDLARANETVVACARGERYGTYQSSAFFGQGLTYSRARGRVGAYMQGSPDAFRPEPARGPSSIDDPYTDGISITAWTPEGRKHLATYTVGLSFSNRDYSYYRNGNCNCHGGSELAPDWLGENYFCDSGLRCDAVCDTAEACEEACSSDGENGRRFFINGVWYDDHGLMFTDVDYICRGNRVAQRSDFPTSLGVEEGGFYWENDDDALITGPVEVRVMSGQRSFTPVDENGEPSGTPNEDVGIAFLDVEVYGCVQQEDAECGNGVVDFGEECDLGEANDDGINNNWGGECSRACTLWNPDTELGEDGLPCNIYGHDPEQGCSVEPPACPSNDPTPASTSVTEEVRQILPAWVPVLDYSQGFDLSEPCPGNLKKYQHNIYGEAVCSPPYATDFPPAAEGCPDNFYKIVVQAPADAATGEKLCYSGVKGQIVSSTKGPNVHHFLTGEIAAEPNAPGFNKTWYRTDATGEISLESRYVDGISITHGAPGDRKHVFTLAHGMANGSPENAVNDYDTCLGPASTGNNLPTAACYVGNCGCQGADDVMGQSGRFSEGLSIEAPDFVGEDFYCDGGVSEAQSYVWGNAWSDHRVMTGTGICVGREGAKGSEWWASQDLTPGEFRKSLGRATDDDLEVRILTGPDTFYEDVGIMSAKLEVCLCPTCEPCSCDQASQIENEADALLTLKQVTGISLPSWSASDAAGLCTWQGVTCDEEQAITELNLRNVGLTGDVTVPLSSPYLASLQRLDLSGNAVSGDLGSLLSALPALRYLDLSNNQATVFGTLDSLEAVGGQLEYVDISSNDDFTGDLGQFLTDLAAMGAPLQILDVSGTAVDGDITSLPESVTYILAVNTGASGECDDLKGSNGEDLICGF